MPVDCCSSQDSACDSFVTCDGFYVNCVLIDRSIDTDELKTLHLTVFALVDS